MAPRLRFPDAQTAADAGTFASRAAHLGDGAVRLQAQAGTLVMTCAPLAPRGLFDATPTVLGMRVVRVDPELVCDLVVEATTLVTTEDPAALALPDSALSPAWAGISPPRSGWSPEASIAASTLAARAQWGIASVAESVPKDAGEDAVRAVRGAIWGAPDPSLDNLALGVSFAAFGLGFIAGEEDVRVLSSGPWTRLTLSRGHVLVRGPVRSGLTAVRTTGTVL